MFIKNDVIFNELRECVSNDNLQERMGMEDNGMTIFNLLLILAIF